jgi:hypothetical protein
MKKMLTLVLVLAVASLANAAMTLTISGAPAIMAPGETATLRITASGFTQGDGISWGLLCDPANGIISGGTAAALPNATMVQTDPEWQTYYPQAGINGLIDTFETSDTYTCAGGDYIFDITFTAVAGPFAVIQLVTTNDFENFPVVDSASVQIVPEPITMSLLGLGGLFLRRKK